MIGLSALAGAALVPVARAANAAPLADIERRHGGRLGVYAIDTGSGRELAHRADERFLMCSTFKGMLAAQVLARVDAGKEQLDRLVHYTAQDLIFTSPITKANVARGALPVRTLCEATIEESDNTAAILLMRSAGGPAALTQFLRDIGDTLTRSDRYEPDSNRNSGVLDTTTPRAISRSARAVLLGNVLRTLVAPSGATGEVKLLLLGVYLLLSAAVSVIVARFYAEPLNRGIRHWLNERRRVRTVPSRVDP
jgi:beta-lactamase class A